MRAAFRAILRTQAATPSGRSAANKSSLMSRNFSSKNAASAADPEKWYADRFEIYESFTRLLHATVENLVRAAGIEYLSVTSRTKSLASFAEKMKRKGYESADLH